MIVVFTALKGRKNFAATFQGNKQGFAIQQEYGQSRLGESGMDRSSAIFAAGKINSQLLHRSTWIYTPEKKEGPSRDD